MKIVNQRPWPVYVAEADAHVAPGETLEVPKPLADRLLAQPTNWTKVGKADDSEDD